MFFKKFYEQNKLIKKYHLDYNISQHFEIRLNQIWKKLLKNWSYGTGPVDTCPESILSNLIYLMPTIVNYLKIGVQILFWEFSSIQILLYGIEY